MCITKCEHHTDGYKAVVGLCLHIESAVNAARPLENVFIHWPNYACHVLVLCDECVRRHVPEPLDAAAAPMCVECFFKWSDTVIGDVRHRCRHGVAEMPPDVSPWSFQVPPGAVIVGTSAFIYEGRWCVVTSTGVWPASAHPAACISVVERPWGDVHAMLVAPDGVPFPFEVVVEHLLQAGGWYGCEQAISFILSGFPASSSVLALAISAAASLPPRRREAMEAALRRLLPGP